MFCVETPPEPFILTFKVTNQSRIISKHIDFETDFGNYTFKGSAELIKDPSKPRYYPVTAKMSVFERTPQGAKFVGKIRVKEFNEQRKATDIIADIATNSPFDKSQIMGLLDTAMYQLHIV